MDYWQFGLLAHQATGELLTNKVLKSKAGYYIGTELDGVPCTRESREYYEYSFDAKVRLITQSWTQRTQLWLTIPLYIAKIAAIVLKEAN